MEYSVGDKIEPCGRPAGISLASERPSLIWTLKVRFEVKALMVAQRYLGKPIL